MNALVTTQELAQHPEWRVFDCRHDLLKPEWGAQEYQREHIPGALFAHMEHDLSGPKTGSNGRHPLPEAKAFIAWLGRQGLAPTDTVVCYDAGNGATASRSWWMLRWVGHADVAVLDGGYAKWAREGRPVTAEVPAFHPVAYPGKAMRSMAIDVTALARRLKRAFTVDARAPARYRGEQEPIDKVAGRIPGARNRFNGENVTADGTFKPADILRGEFLALLGDRAPAEVVHYCGSGVAACHNLIAMEIAGLPGGKLYAGSWSEWSADPTRPIARSA